MKPLTVLFYCSLMMGFADSAVARGGVPTLYTAAQETLSHAKESVGYATARAALKTAKATLDSLKATNKFSKRNYEMTKPAAATYLELLRGVPHDINLVAPKSWNFPGAKISVKSNGSIIYNTLQAGGDIVIEEAQFVHYAGDEVGIALFRVVDGLFIQVEAPKEEGLPHTLRLIVDSNLNDGLPAEVELKAALDNY